MVGGVMSGCRGGVDSCGIGSDTIELATSSGGGGGTHLRRYSDARAQKGLGEQFGVELTLPSMCDPQRHMCNFL